MTAPSEHDVQTIADGAHESGFERLVESIYRAGAGLAPWEEPLQAIARRFALWEVQFFAMDKRTGGLIFSHDGGRCTPEVALDYFRKYHRIDPRTGLVFGGPVGQWIACDEHFDEDYVARSPFYQQFLIPYGGRYVYGAKIAEDDGRALVIAFLRGAGHSQLDARERAALQLLAWHLEHAFRMKQEVSRSAAGQALGLAVLERMRQPLMVLDADRRIAFCNDSGRELLARGDLLVDRAGFAICRDGESDVELLLAMRELALPAGGGAVAVDRRSVRLRRAGQRARVASTLLALRPQHVMGAFGNAALAMLVIYEPGMAKDPDPFLLAATFDFTPAEGRVASRLVSGMSIKEIAAELGVAISTVRTQVKSIFDKTGTNRQAELVRVLLLAGEF
jgi:DNA-binding CsgD family transcriptional regulator/PAS domain-containing protein